MVRIRCMANQDDFVKTALRLPRDLHAQVQAAATARGRSMNAEIIERLRDEGTASVELVLERLRSREAELLEANKRQLSVMRNVIERMRPVLAQAETVLDANAEDPAVAALREKIDFCTALIEAIDAYKAE